MKYMTTAEIRKSFLDFFEDRGHRIVRSGPLIPAEDPTLLFANAGMNQFKDVFLGREKRDYTRAASAQKCMRAGGKHNDLENVGFTARHHTFFEMLGNFSFGDYFKEDAIKFSWEWVTDEKYLGLPKDRIFATVFHEDDESYAIWRDVVGVPEERIYRLGEKDNYWSMGDTGPQGPCSEIIFDMGEEYACGDKCEIGVCDCDRWIEIWNNVFMQFNRDAEGNVSDLPRPSVDTGAGLERIAMIMQGRTTTYDIDVLTPLIEKVRRLSQKGPVCKRRTKAQIQSERVIADHVRALTFAITDGAVPSNLGRGYVIRRILRRAARFGRKLGFEEPFIYKIVPLVVELMGEQYPEIKEKQNQVIKIIRNEEAAFIKTLETGSIFFENESAKLKKQNKNTIPGKTAFKLYSTYGFPLDLTELMAREIGMNVDTEGYEKELARHIEVSDGGVGVQRENTKTTDLTTDLSGVDKTVFTGYDRTEEKAIIKLAKDKLLVTDKTPFYAESGGQIGDSGNVEIQGTNYQVENTFKHGDYIIHKLNKEPHQGIIEKTVVLKVKDERRNAIKRAHTATHLLHAALKQVLGDHVNQTGSLVEPDKLRFDLTHFEAIKPEEITEIERIVNEKITDGTKIECEEKGIDEAKKEGATALFGEKYGERVRVVSVPGFSKELCGGTHISNTAEIGRFKIISEGSIQAGTRRIEALTGEKAGKYVAHRVKLYKTLAKILGVTPEEAEAKIQRHLGADFERDLEKAAQILKTPVEKLTEKVKSLERDLGGDFKGAIKKGFKDLAAGSEAVISLLKKKNREKARSAQADLKTLADELLDKAQRVEGSAVIAERLENLGPGELRKISDFIRDREKSYAVGLASVEDDMPRLFVGLSPDLVKAGLHAGNLVKGMAEKVGGGGGGRPDFAQAGGKDVAGVEASLALFRSRVEAGLGKKS